MYDLERGTQTRLTFDPVLDGFPVWTPDGERIAFSSFRGGQLPDVFWKLANGTGDAELVVSDPDLGLQPWSWTPDGQTLVLNQGGFDLGMVTLEGERTRQPLLEEPFHQGAPEVSPDGRWLAYRSDESGQFEVYVRPFPNVADGKWPVSTAGGGYPGWSPDGSQLFYRTLDGASLMGVTVDTEPTFRVGIPEILVEGDYAYGFGRGRSWDISPDGQRFLMMKTVGETDPGSSPTTQITFVQNWFEELKRLAPVN